jgi:hypothetical protein
MQATVQTVTMVCCPQGLKGQIFNTENVLTLSWMVGGIYESQNLNRYNSKWAEVKIFFYSRSIPHKMLELYLVKGFYKKMF